MIIMEVILMDGYTFTVPAQDEEAALREAHTIAVVGFTFRQNNRLTHLPPHQVRTVRWTVRHSNIPEVLSVEAGPAL